MSLFSSFENFENFSVSADHLSAMDLEKKPPTHALQMDVLKVSIKECTLKNSCILIL